MPNHLKDQRSAYLLQHAENPVDWYPWGEEAFEKARREDRPVFLSIGYSTCHWCHVMAQESFENEQVAEILNRAFVSVKVDREERGDVDAVYMELCTRLNGGGGWPLTVIMTAEQKPFFVGTYLPRENRDGRAGLIPMLLAVERLWNGDRRALLKTGEDLSAMLLREQPADGGEPDRAFAEKALAQLLDAYDPEYGGFGSAPKFPSPQDLLFLLRMGKLSGEGRARPAAERTLQQMARGGIFDHLGGGFARYSTDREWLAPHFEKTLYDNALLAYTYAEAWQEGHFECYRTTAEATLDYCLRELRGECGGFYSGQDADSEGGEGSYYLFTPEEVKGVLGEEDGRHFCECYDVTPEGNYRGKSIPNLLLNPRWNLLPEGYGDFRERLRLYRAGRMDLRTDKKLPTGWNGLMLAALAGAARIFSDRRYAAAARELGTFLRETAGAAEPERLRAVCYEGDSPFLPAQLDDLAFCALGFLELYRLDYDPGCIRTALALAEQITAHFACEDGGYYRSSDRAERLLKRPREIFDGALPSGNSAAALLFERLGRLTGELRWREAAREQLRFLCARSGRAPAGIAFGLLALLPRLYGGRELVAVSGDVPKTLQTASARYAPELTLLLKRPGDRELAAVAPFTESLVQKDGRPTFYLCRDGSCSLPFTEET